MMSDEDFESTSGERIIYFFVMFTNFFGGLLLIFGEFGGYRQMYWTHSTKHTGATTPYYSNPFYTETGTYYETVIISVFDDPYTAPILITFAAILFYFCYLAFQGCVLKEKVPRDKLSIGFLLALIVFSLVNVGAKMILSTEGEDISSWVGTGYLGAVTGSFFAMISFGFMWLRSWVSEARKNSTYKF
jgi:hypothetical protein